MDNQSSSFEEIQTRLQEIVDAVQDDSLPLDDALTLYEEAVQLGLRASALLEEGISLGSAEDENATQASDVSSQEETSSSRE